MPENGNGDSLEEHATMRGDGRTAHKNPISSTRCVVLARFCFILRFLPSLSFSAVASTPPSPDPPGGRLDTEDVVDRDLHLARCPVAGSGVLLHRCHNKNYV